MTACFRSMRPTRLARLARPVLAAVLALAWWPVAWADLWGYVDEAGVVHFAATQVDARYQLYYKGSDAARLNLNAPALGLLPQAGAARGLRPGSGVAGKGAFVPPRRFASLDYDIGYKAVRHHIRAAAQAHAVDYALLKAVIAAESGFDPRAVSPKGAVGLMQLLPTTASQYGVQADAAGSGSSPPRSVHDKLTDPRTNIFAGARHLAYLIKLFHGDTELAVAAYNAGQGAVRRAGNQVPAFKETQNYVHTVMGLYDLFTPATAAPPARGLSPPAATDMSGMSGMSAMNGKGSRVRVSLPALSAASAASASPPAPPASAAGD